MSSSSSFGVQCSLHSQSTTSSSSELITGRLSGRAVELSRQRSLQSELRPEGGHAGSDYSTLRSKLGPVIHATPSMSRSSLENRRMLATKSDLPALLVSQPSDRASSQTSSSLEDQRTQCSRASTCYPTLLHGGPANFEMKNVATQRDIKPRVDTCQNAIAAESTSAEAATTTCPTEVQTRKRSMIKQQLKQLRRLFTL